MVNDKTALVSSSGSNEYGQDKIELIKRTVCVGATNDELQMFLYTARRVGLDPLLRQIHAVKRWNAAAGREVMSIQTGIDGYRLIADRSGKLAGITDAEYDSEDKDHPNKATVTVSKLIDGTVKEFTASARWGEFAQYKKSKDGNPPEVNAMWAKMPYHMLGKCAEALALRKAFPFELSGLYADEEMLHEEDITNAPPINKPSPEIQRKSQKAAQAQGKNEAVICSECRVTNGHSSDCKYFKKPEEKAASTSQAPAGETKEDKFASRWASYVSEEGKAHDPAVHINANQGKLFYKIIKDCGLPEDEVKAWLQENCDTRHAPLIPKALFEAVLDGLDPEFAFHKEKPPVEDKF